jgi:hypothetical protein
VYVVGAGSIVFALHVMLLQMPRNGRNNTLKELEVCAAILVLNNLNPLRVLHVTFEFIASSKLDDTFKG